MNDKQFEALLGAISQLTLAVREHTSQIDETLIGISAHMSDLNDLYKVAHNIHREWGLSDLDTPIGGDGN